MASSETLVFGTDGQVAHGLHGVDPSAKYITRDECDFGVPENIIPVLNRYKPRLVINPAAYTAVDRAETESDLAFRVNAYAPAAIARWCAEHGASMIHYSTDYVFDGTGELARSEEAQVGPINQYGLSKLEGEREVQASGCHHVILRTSWVFSEIGQNFVRTMLRLGAERESLRVVADAYGAPTYAVDLAAATFQIVAHPKFKQSNGVFHISNSGTTSWYGFAQRIFSEWRALGGELKVKEVTPIATADYPTPAARPLNSRLDLSKLEHQLGIQMRPWSEALVDALRALKKSR